MLGSLVFLLVTAAFVYVDDFLLDRYMRSLAGEPGSVSLSDAELSDRVLERARQLGLPVPAWDVTVTRDDGRPHIQIGTFGVQTYLGRMDLRMPAAVSR